MKSTKQDKQGLGHLVHGPSTSARTKGEVCGAGKEEDCGAGLTARQLLTLLVPGPRPWDNEPDGPKVKQFKYKSVQCEIKRHPSMFHLCGYIHLWPEQVTVDMHEGHVAEIPLHGGVTFFDRRLRRRGSVNMQRFTIGFDCAHIDDMSPGVLIAKSYLRGETTYELLPTYSEDLTTYRDMTFVADNLKQSVDWLYEEGLLHPLRPQPQRRTRSGKHGAET